MMRHTYISGFTLIELLVAISIIGLLSGVVTASLNSSREKARITSAKQADANFYHSIGDQAVGIWDFDECTGIVAGDRSGNGNAGTLTNMATSSWSSDTPFDYGCSLVFDGVNDYVNVPDAPSLNLSEFTITLWAKTTATADTIMLGKGTDSVRNYSVHGGYYNHTHGSGVWTGVGYLKPLSTGLWEHVAITVDGTTAISYRNGANPGRATVQSADISNGSLAFGRMGSGSSYFTGQIDAVRIYARSLSASEVGKLYAESVPQYRFADINSNRQ